MASYCFCGCGRKVRFSKKRFSDWGAEAGNAVHQLEQRLLPAIPEGLQARTVVDMLISQGKRFEVVFQELVHGAPAPPVDEGVEFRRQFHRWQDNAREALSHAAR